MFTEDKNVLYLIWLMITQVYIAVKFHQTEHLKSEVFFVHELHLKKKKKSGDWFIGDPHIFGLKFVWMVVTLRQI